MKVYGWRHKRDKYCVWMSDDKKAVDAMLNGWLNSIGSPWDDKFVCFEEIEAEITYEDEGF